MKSKHIATLFFLTFGSRSHAADIKDFFAASKISMIEATYERNILPSPLSEEDINKKIDSIRSQIASKQDDTNEGGDPLMGESIEKLIGKTRRNIMDGSKYIYNVAIHPGVDGIIGSFELKNSDPATDKSNAIWVYLDKNKLVEYNSAIDSITISSSKAPERSLLGVMLADLGSWGNPLLLEKNDVTLSNDKLSAIVKYPVGQKRVNFSSEQKWIQSEEIELESNGGSQKEVHNFKDFEAHLGGLCVPHVIESTFESGQTKQNSLIKLEKVSFGVEQRDVTAASLPQFGLTTVTDTRVSPPLVFRALNILPSDEEIANLAISQANLAAHNKKILDMVKGGAR